MKKESNFAKAMPIFAAIASQAGGLSFGDLIETCNEIPRATLARQIKALVVDGLIEKENGQYFITNEFRQFCKKVLRCIPRGELIQPILNALSHNTGESSAYFELDGDGVKCFAKCDMPESWNFLPVYARNKGLTHQANVTILAHESKEMVDACLELYNLSQEEKDNHRKLLKNWSRENSGQGVPVIVSGKVVGAIIFSHLAKANKANKADMLRQALQSAAKSAEQVLAENGY